MWHMYQVTWFVWDILVCAYHVGVTYSIALYSQMFSGLEEKLCGHYTYEVMESKCAEYSMPIKQWCGGYKAIDHDKTKRNHLPTITSKLTDVRDYELKECLLWLIRNLSLNSKVLVTNLLLEILP